MLYGRLLYVEGVSKTLQYLTNTLILHLTLYQLSLCSLENVTVAGGSCMEEQNGQKVLKLQV